MSRVSPQSTYLGAQYRRHVTHDETHEAFGMEGPPRPEREAADAKRLRRAAPRGGARPTARLVVVAGRTAAGVLTGGVATSACRCGGTRTTTVRVGVVAVILAGVVGTHVRHGRVLVYVLVGIIAAPVVTVATLVACAAVGRVLFRLFVVQRLYIQTRREDGGRAGKREVTCHLCAYTCLCLTYYPTTPSSKADKLCLDS